MKHCSYSLLAIRDTIDVLSGKWKVPIIGALLQTPQLGFNDLLRELDGITSKVLAEVLRELEGHQLASRTVMNTKPITVEYAITTYGKTTETIIAEMLNWGLARRKRLTGKDSPDNKLTR